jgi:hypothetical protein
MDIVMLYNTIGEYKEDVIKWTKIYRLDLDGKEYGVHPFEKRNYGSSLTHVGNASSSLPAIR